MGSVSPAQSTEGAKERVAFHSPVYPHYRPAQWAAPEPRLPGRARESAVRAQKLPSAMETSGGEGGYSNRLCFRDAVGYLV